VGTWKGPNLVDLAVASAMAATALWFAYRLNVGLRYNWNWGVIPQFFFYYDEARSRWVPNLLVKGFVTTLKLGVWATVLATPIGVVSGLMRLSSRLFFRMAGRAYVELIRNMPPLVLVFIVYYFIGDHLIRALGIEALLASPGPRLKSLIEGCCAPVSKLPVFASAVVMLALYEGAYITEIVRAGVQSIDRGQWEASAALGMSRFQQLRHVVLPQALVRILPPYAGQVISTVKDSSIVSVISIPELTFQGMEIMASTYRTFEIWITVAVMYFVITFACSMAVHRLEAAMARRGGAA